MNERNSGGGGSEIPSVGIDLSELRKEGDLNAKLEALRSVEHDIRREKSALLKEKPWYQNPNYWIGIFGIIATIVVAIWTTYERKVLTFSYTTPSSLILDTPAVKSKSTITFDGKPVPDLGRIIMRLSNTGTKPILSSDFNDGPLSFTVSSSKNEGNSGSNTELPLLLDVVSKNSAGQKQAKLEIVSRENPASFTYMPSLLNPDDQVEFEIYTSKVDDLTISLDGKLVGGRMHVLGPTNNDIDAVSGASLKNVFRSVNQMLGGKWVTLLILVLGIIFSGFILLILFDAITYVTEWYEYVAITLNVTLIITFAVGFIFNIFV